MTKCLFALYVCPCLLFLASCGDDKKGDVDAGIDAKAPTGTFNLRWSLTDGSNPLQCAQVGAVSVSVAVVPRGGFSGVVEPLPCEQGSATSQGYAPGIYDLEIDLRASFGRSLLAEPVAISAVEIKADTSATLPAQEFVVDPRGAFSFLVAADAASGNCALVADNGAGIVGFDFVLLHEGECVETDLSIADGALPGGTYRTSCSEDATSFACIGRDQLITAENLPSGSYSLQISAKKEDPDLGPIVCYNRVTNFKIAGSGLRTEVGSLNLALLYSQECDPNFVPPDAGPEADASPSVDANGEISDAGLDGGSA